MDEIPHVQVKLTSNSTRYSMPDHPFSVPANLEQPGLSKMVNQLLLEEDDKWAEAEFDFLIEEELLRSSLEDHITRKGLSAENLVYIECVCRTPPPNPDLACNHSDWVGAVSINNRQQILTGCYDNTAHIWSDKGQLLASMSGPHSGPVKAVKWVGPGNSPHPLVLTGSGDQYVYVWKLDSDRAAAEVLAVCKGHARSVEGLATEPQGQMFASISFDKMVKVWTMDVKDAADAEDVPAKKKAKGEKNKNTPATKTPLMTMSGHTQAVTGVVWTTPTDIITCGWDQCIRLWDVPSGVNKSNLVGSEAFTSLDSCTPTPHLLATASCNSLVRIWDTRVSEKSLVKLKLTAHRSWAKAVKWSPSNSNQLVSTGYDGLVKLWDIRSPLEPLFTMVAHKGKSLCLDWSQDGCMVVSGGEDCYVRSHSMN